MVVYIILILLCIYIIYIMFKSYKDSEYNMFWYNFLKLPLGIIFKLYYPYKRVNKLDLPSGPVVICSNHIHLMDQCLTILESKRPIHYMAKKEYFDNPKVSWFFKMVGCIPVDRSKKDANAKSKAKEVLDKGLVLGIFPEGTRNKTDEDLLPFKFGAVSFAKASNATIIPVAVTGKYHFRTKNLKIAFGEGFKVEGDLEEANQKLYNIILQMIRDGK